MVYVYFYCMIALLFQTVTRKYRSSLVNNLFLSLCSGALALFIAEFFLTITGIAKTHMEQNKGYYRSHYSMQESSYRSWPPGVPHELSSSEFSYWRNTNSMGFADVEWRRNRKGNEKRIMALGDSFTEGDGAPYDSGYVSILRQILSNSSDSFYVMNAGICGSDPFNNYINLKDRLLSFKPDIIIQSIGSDDMLSDIRLRGGMERFQKDSTARYRPAPRWEPIYAISYVSRMLFKIAGYNEMLQTTKLSLTDKKRIDQSVEDLFQRYSLLCRQNGIKLILVFHPQEDELEANKYNYDFTNILHHLPVDGAIRVVDLLPSYQEYSRKSKSNVSDYYWKSDGHHNSKGYKMMAETTLQNIRPILKDSLK